MLDRDCRSHLVKAETNIREQSNLLSELNVALVI